MSKQAWFTCVLKQNASKSSIFSVKAGFLILFKTCVLLKKSSNKLKISQSSWKQWALSFLGNTAFPPFMPEPTQRRFAISMAGQKVHVKRVISVAVSDCHPGPWCSSKVRVRSWNNPSPPCPWIPAQRFPPAEPSPFYTSFTHLLHIFSTQLSPIQAPNHLHHSGHTAGNAQKSPSHAKGENPGNENTCHEDTHPSLPWQHPSLPSPAGLSWVSSVCWSTFETHPRFSSHQEGNIRWHYRNTDAKQKRSF